MPLLEPQQYVQSRIAYCYNAPDCSFTVIQTGGLCYEGNFNGIFSKNIPSHYPNGINMRRFEIICQEIFGDCSNALLNNSFSHDHLNNLKNISAAIVFWKMSSQGGRSNIKS